MFNDRDILETPDERNCDRLHQQHKHTIKAIKTRSQILSQRSSEKLRSPARSWKREESMILYRDNEDFPLCWNDGLLKYKRRSYYKGELLLTSYSIMKAIQDEDADYFDFAIKQIEARRDWDITSHVWILKPSHTILTYAIHIEKSDFIQTLIQSIANGFIRQTIVNYVCPAGKTALWYACKKGDFDLVLKLVEYVHANVKKHGVLIVAAQNGHKKIVEYLLHKGCDPNQRAKHYNELALHAAARRNHLGIVKTLLRYGADPTILDYKKRTALDYAIHKRYINIAKVLIQHHAGCFSMNQIGFTPFMLATHRNNKPIIDILSNILSYQQYIDELVLLACNYTIYGNTSKRDQAYGYFEKALSMNTSSINTTPCEAYEFRCECQTLDELALIREDDNAMRIYALLVSERLLLRSNQVKHFVSLLMKQSDVYKCYGSFYRCLQLRLYAYRLVIEGEHKDWRNSMLHKNCLFELVSILFKILQKENSVPVETLEIVWIWILNRADNKLTKCLFKLIFMTTYVSKNLNGKEQRILFGLVQRTMHQKFTMPNGHFLFSYCISLALTGCNDFKFSSIRIPALSVIQLLIDCGANVNEADLKRKSTPLHLATHSSNVNNTNNARFFINLLLDANAHTDCIDMYGHLPEYYAWILEIKELLQANRKLSLKCRCEQLIVSENVCYKNSLSTHLIDFIQMHDIY